MKKALAVILSLICIISTVTGCSGSGDSGTALSAKNETETQAAAGTEKQQEDTKDNVKTEVTIGFSGDPDTWDPCAGFGYTGSPLFSTLVKVNGDNELENDLATEYSMSEDGLTWTFKLRDDVIFSNGEELKADDVAFTFNQTKVSAAYVDLTMMDDCIAVDDTTVEFKLNKPCVTFIYTIAGAGIVPKDSYSDNFGTEPIGSGPYKLTQWDKGQQFIFEVNENYYGEEPEIKKAIFLVQEEDARLVAAKAGEVDIALTSATLAKTEIEGMKVISVQSVDNRGITFPTVPDEGKVTEDGYKIGNNITCDIAIRKAMCYGIDRQQIIDEALNGFANPAYSECDGLPWWNEEDVIETDVDYAVKMLEDAGWKDTDGDGIREKGDLKAEFNVMYFAGDSMRQAVAMSVANQAKENLGISITVEGVNAGDTVKRMFSEPMIMGWGSSSPMTSYMLYHSSNAGKTDFYNPEFFTSDVVDEYMDKAMTSKTLEDSIEWWQKAQWDGTTGTSMRGEAPWAFYINMSHLYYAKEGLDIGKQRIHAHGAAWPLVVNLAEWKWTE
ncbi:MAG: ABC transporter substrate-binding protein [Lachnospiraceae bacterium]|nr:ABC transporter substrate-binding protein [Lachnospiraceae bacterium]